MPSYMEQIALFFSLSSLSFGEDFIVHHAPYTMHHAVYTMHHAVYTMHHAPGAYPRCGEGAGYSSWRHPG